MTFGGFLFLAALIVVGIIVFAVIASQKEQEKINAMSPAEKNNYIFGPINEHLICQHCQTRGTVHARMAVRSSTSTGKVGGILKTDTTSTTTTTVTQHHCDQCGTTWDV